MTSRRDFIRTLSAASVGVGVTGIPFELLAKKDIIKITVLHTNDVHSRIEAFPDNDPKYPGMGGVAQRAAIINEIRNKEKNVLLLDAGDIFQGTPYFNLFKGEVEMKLMSQLKYDAGTIGNHDFDNGVDGLADMLKYANFPLLNCNYDFRNTAMEDKTKPYKIFEMDSARIGVFGIGIELKGLVPDKLIGNTKYLDPMEKAAVAAHYLKHTEKCDIVICLSHLGYKYPDEKISDDVLAKKSLNIDLIIGGHTHTFIDTPYKYYNRDGKPVYIAQVGWAGIKLGRIDFFIEKKKRIVKGEGTSLKISKKTIAV
ncbi:MAG TPA: metallophosphoesterase [Bacteroidia bacterium]|nr:metallophosphoesterase [Bacteroidia bacterium]HNU32661.1 metallophosphoesterase [Bacteroidia bacterium]